MNKLIVKAKLPPNANLSMRECETVIISTHTSTWRGAKNALKSVRKTHKEYTESYGQWAVREVWVEYFTEYKSGAFRVNADVLELLETNAVSNRWSKPGLFAHYYNLAAHFCGVAKI